MAFMSISLLKIQDRMPAYVMGMSLNHNNDLDLVFYIRCMTQNKIW